ncbi:O-antigen polymerase [Limosilactobacillus pontis]|uniref:O-antigen polymerase n=1 Tax=Limosilactobacillus pontis TaxID=35787 RepID=UPI002F26B7A7
MLCVIFSFIGYASEKKILNPITIMCVLWGMIVSFSNLQLYGLYSVENSTYKIISEGIYFFIAGYYVSKLMFNLLFNKNKVSLDNSFSFEVNYNKLYILYIVCIVYTTIRIGQYGLGIFSNGFNLASMGNYINSASNSSSGLLAAIGFLIVTPLFFPLLIVSSMDLIFGKRNRLLFLLTIVLVLERIVVYGGRLPIIQFIITMLIITSFGNKKSLLKRKNSFFRIGAITIGIGIFIGLTLTKMTDSSTSIWKGLYLEFAMQPYMFQTWGTMLSSNSYAYGFASLFGFVHPILYVLENLGFFSTMPLFFLNIYTNIQNTFNMWIPIGNQLTANAYTSAFWYLYYDGRNFGIILGMFILGILAFYFFNKAIKLENAKNISNYVMVAFCLIYTFTDMELYKYDFILGMLYLNFLIYRKIK